MAIDRGRRRLGGRSELDSLEPALGRVKRVSARLGNPPTLTLAPSLALQRFAGRGFGP